MDTKLTIFQSDGTTAAIDYRTEATNGDGRQVITIGDSLINANVAAVATQDLPGTDQTTPALVVRHAGSIVVQQINASVAVYFSPTVPTVIANAGSGTLTIKTDPGYELGSIKQINSSVAVYFDRGNPSINIGSQTSTLNIFIPDTGHEIGTIRGNTNTLTVFLPDTGHTLGKFDAGVGTFGVNLGKQDGTLSVKLDPGAYAFVNAFHTASIFNASGSYVGNSASGGQIIAPSANASFKIFAFSLTTTAQSNITAKFTNGSAGSPVEYWRVALQAPTQGISGANLAVTPPGHLWATGASTTLSLVLDSASLVHYSVSFIKESA